VGTCGSKVLQKSVDNLVHLLLFYELYMQEVGMNKISETVLYSYKSLILISNPYMTTSSYPAEYVCTQVLS
jgi:hypothetical protein